MEQVFVVVLIAGLLLFFGGYLYVAYIAFRRHTITGLIALVPLLNIVTLPTVWREAQYAFYASILGVLLIAGSWYTGADKQLLASLAITDNDNIETLGQDSAAPSLSTSTLSASLPLDLPLQRPSEITLSNQAEADAVKQQVELEKSQKLNSNGDYITQPAPPFHRQEVLQPMVFEVIPLTDISRVVGKMVRIKTNEQRQIEGKVLSVDDKQLVIEERVSTGSLSYDIDVANITTLEMMVRK